MLARVHILYKLTLSPLFGERCRFYPCCSDYALEACTKHGIIVGVLLSLYRIVRCNPLSKGGVEEVPKRLFG